MISTQPVDNDVFALTSSTSVSANFKHPCIDSPTQLERLQSFRSALIYLEGEQVVLRFELASLSTVAELLGTHGGGVIGSGVLYNAISVSS